jgi:hypothetical protein
MAAIGSMIVLLIIVSVLPLVVVCLAYPYLALRLRDSREDHRDPELGIKTACYLILSAAILLILFGLTVSAIDVMEGTLEKRNQARQQPVPGQVQQQRDPFERLVTETTQRTAWALTVSGLLFALSAMLLLKMGTNDVHFPAAKRVFVGGRLAFIAVVVMIAVTVLIVLFFQKEVPRKEPYEVLIGVLIVWTPALAVHIFLMRYYASQPYYVEKKSYSSRSSRSDREYEYDDD